MARVVPTRAIQSSTSAARPAVESAARELTWATTSPGPRRRGLSSAPRFQPGQSPGAAAEHVGLDAHALKHAHEEIAKGRVIGLIEGQMLAVPEAAAGQQDRHVLDAVLAGVAQVAAEEDHRPVEQALVA